MVEITLVYQWWDYIERLSRTSSRVKALAGTQFIVFSSAVPLKCTIGTTWSLFAQVGKRGKFISLVRKDRKTIALLCHDTTKIPSLLHHMIHLHIHIYTYMIQHRVLLKICLTLTGKLGSNKLVLLKYSWLIKWPCRRDEKNGRAPWRIVSHVRETLPEPLNGLDWGLGFSKINLALLIV